MKWPEGKWNGRRIIGVSFKIKLIVTQWRWLPQRVKYVGGLHWLCFLTWTEWEYEDNWEKLLRTTSPTDDRSGSTSPARNPDAVH